MAGSQSSEPDLNAYPDRYHHAILLGINGYGYAEFYLDTSDDSLVFLASLDDDGTLITPPPEYGIGSELSLDEFGWSLQEYLHKSVDEHGKWRALSAFSQELLAEPDDLTD